MEWEHLFIEKNNWQRDTFERIKRSLISAKDSHFIKYDSSDENHLVIVYGKSQVGKTTLILNMIGIKEENFKEVHDTLRAGIPRGNSSTSTAIIYTKSNNQQYGFSLSKINSVVDKKIEYYDCSGMINRLDDMRKAVEKNKVNTEDILYIYIPNNYFTDDAKKCNISIMDMPGIESKNQKEKVHVENLMTRYIPAASVCLIVCRSNDIQHLENLKLPNGINWRNMYHKFILVITHAYINGNIKSYFNNIKSERKTGFFEYVTNSYIQEIRNVLGNKNQTEVFPIDVGDSLIKLCKEEIKNSSDCSEIIKTKNQTLENLRKAILNHEGERLKSALADLREIVDCYGSDEIDEIDSKIKSNKNNIREKENKIQKINEYIKDIAVYRQDLYEDKQKKISIEVNFNNILFNINQYWNLNIEKYIEEEKIFKGKGYKRYLKDKNKKLISYMRDYGIKFIDDFMKNINQIISSEDIKISISSQYYLEQVDLLILYYENIIYPEKVILLSPKVYLSEIQNYYNEIKEKVDDLLKEFLNKYIEVIETSIYETQQKIDYFNSSEKKQLKNIKNYKDNISKLNIEICELENDKLIIENQKKQDKDSLNMYLKYAEEAYLSQRNDIIKRINTVSSVNDKMLLILFMGILDKDYIKITGGTNENTNKYRTSI